MFKKISFVVLFLLFLWFATEPREISKPVSLEVNDNDYHVYTLDFSDTVLTTKYFDTYFTDQYIVISVVPFLNPIYENKLEILVIRL